MNEDSVATSLENIPNRIGRTAEERAEWARRFCESGLSLRKFSAQHGLHWYALWRWVKTREKSLKQEWRLDAQVMEFAEIKMPEHLPATEWVAEISFPDGKVLRFSKEVPVSTVEQLLRVC